MRFYYSTSHTVTGCFSRNLDIRLQYTKLGKITDADKGMHESTTFWKRSLGHLYSDKYANPDSNPGSLLVGASKVPEVGCTWRWGKYALECSIGT